MGYKIEYNNPAYPKGEELGIAGLGVLKNGESLVVSDADMKSYVDTRNALSGEDERKTAATLLSGDMFKVQKVSDPSEPSEETVQATEETSPGSPGVTTTSTA